MPLSLNGLENVFNGNNAEEFQFTDAEASARAERRKVCGALHFTCISSGKFKYVPWLCHDYRLCPICQSIWRRKIRRGVIENTRECDGAVVFQFITNEQAGKLIEEYGLTKEDYARLPHGDGKAALIVRRGILDETKLQYAGTVMETRYLEKLDREWYDWTQTPEGNRTSGLLKNPPPKPVSEDAPDTVSIEASQVSAVTDAPPDEQVKAFREAVIMTEAHPKTAEEVIQASQKRMTVAIERLVFHGFNVKCIHEKRTWKITSNDILHYYNEDNPETVVDGGLEALKVIYGPQTDKIFGFARLKEVIDCTLPANIAVD